MSDSLNNKTTGEDKPKTEAEFKSADIGRWASQQENPFAAQNRETLAKKQERDAKRKKTAPFVIIIASIAAVAVGVVGLVVLINILTRPESVELPAEISGNTIEDMTNYQDALQNIFNNFDGTDQEKAQEIDQIINEVLETGSSEQYKNEIKLSQAFLYFNNGLCSDVVVAGKQIDAMGLDKHNRLLYYNLMYYCYEQIGEGELSLDYENKLFDLSNEMSGEGF